MIRRTVFIASFAVLMSLAAHGQAPSGGAGWDKLTIEAGFMEIDLNSGRPKVIRGGASIVIVPDDPSQKELRVRSDEITFDVDGDGALSRAVFNGHVHVDHSVGTINAGHADWNLKTNVVDFTGDPVITSDRFKEAKAEKIVLNLATNSMTLEGKARVVDAQLRGAEGATASDPSLLQERDIGDWPGFVAKMKADSTAEGATPAKQVLATLDAKSQQMFQGASVDALLQNKGQVVKMLNKAITSPKLYSMDAWAGVTLDDATQAQVKEMPASGPALTKLNRQLLAAAYPSAFTR